MKELTIYAVMALLCVLSYAIGSNTHARELNWYKEYYHATENLLDTLESEYNWVDAVDHYEYYNAITNIERIKK